MLIKNKYFSRLLSFLFIISLSLSTYLSVSAETVERYKVTGLVEYDTRNAGGFDDIYGEHEIVNGFLERSPYLITLTYSHKDIGDIRLKFIRNTSPYWQLYTFNDIDYSTSNYLVTDEPISSNTTIAFALTNHSPNGFIYMNFKDIQLEQILDSNTIPNGQYSGTGKASVETVFGSFNLGNLAKTKINAVVTDNQLDLSFQAKNIPYQVQANLDSVDADGTAIYTYSDQNESWQITVTPDGKLDGSLTYTGDRGTMNFSIQLQAK